MDYPTYTIMTRRCHCAGTLGVDTGWCPTPWCPSDDDGDAPPHIDGYHPLDGRGILIADSPAAAHALIAYGDALTYHVGRGECGRPEMGYVQPSGRIRRIS